MQFKNTLSCIVTFYCNESSMHVENFLPYTTCRVIVFTPDKNSFTESMKTKNIMIKNNIVVHQSNDMMHWIEFVNKAIEIITEIGESYMSYVWTKICAFSDRILCPFLRYYPDRRIDDGIYCSELDNEKINDVICAGTKTSWLKINHRFNETKYQNKDLNLCCQYRDLVNIINYDTKNWMIPFQSFKELFMINYLIEPKKICVKDGPSCGLGNLMFFIVSSFGYSVETNRVFLLSDNSSVTTSSHSNTNYEDTLFKYFVKYDIAKINNVIQLNESRFDTCIESKNDDLGTNCSLCGYQQNEKYFIHVRDEILFIFDQLYESMTSLIASSIDLPIDYFIHVRRGDYVNNKNHEMNLARYYDNSIKCIKKNDSRWKDRRFVVLSDGIDWCIEKKLFQTHGLKIDYIKNMNEIETFILMVNTRRGGIAANSSYSWWGLWLNKNKKAMRILPKKWHPISSDPQIQFAGATLIDT